MMKMNNRLYQYLIILIALVNTSFVLASDGDETKVKAQAQAAMPPAPSGPYRSQVAGAESNQNINKVEAKQLTQRPIETTPNEKLEQRLPQQVVPAPQLTQRSPQQPMPAPNWNRTPPAPPAWVNKAPQPMPVPQWAKRPPQQPMPAQNFNRNRPQPMPAPQWAKRPPQRPMQAPQWVQPKIPDWVKIHRVVQSHQHG